MSRHRHLSAILIASVAALTIASPAAAGKPPKSDGEFCYDVTFTSEIPVPPPGQVATQSYSLDANCRVVSGPVVVIPASEAPPAFAEASAVQLGTAAANTPEIAAAALFNYRIYATTRIWDCCGILMTEYWTELAWTSTGSAGYIYGYNGVDGAKWHREGPFGCCGGWYLASGSHLLGVTAGGLSKSYVTMRGRQGFGYQGALDPTGTQFYNRLTNWLNGNRNGTWSCTQEVYLKKEPLPPLDWDIQRWCGGGAYPYK